jgi:hypothetical protein
MSATSEVSRQDPDPDADPGTRSTAGAARWRPALMALAALVVITLALYWSTLEDLQRVWSNNAAYGHVVLLGPISAWLIWGVRRRLARTAPRGSVWGAVLALGLSAVWAVSALVDVQVVQQVALLGILGSVILAAGGWRVLRLLGRCSRTPPRTCLRTRSARSASPSIARATSSPSRTGASWLRRSAPGCAS